MPKENVVSGRWVLMIVTAIAFCSMIATACYVLILKTDEITGTEILLFLQNLLQIILAVFAWYFTKRRPEDLVTENENRQKTKLSELGSDVSPDGIRNITKE